MRRVDINQVPAGDQNHNGTSDRLEYVHCGADAACQAALRPFGVFGNNTINFWRNNGTSKYKSLQTQLNSRFGRGSQFQVSYTWSDLTADDPLTDSSGGIFNGAMTDLNNPGLDRGKAGIHRKHVVNSSLVWHAPSFENRGRFVSSVLGDWSLGGVMFYATGVPLTIYTGGVSGIAGGLAGTGYEGNQRPIRVPGQSCRAHGGRKEQWLNPNAWTITGYQLGTTGQMAKRGECEGPSFFEVDLSFYKDIRLGGKLNSQLRIEVFNVTNETNFINVNTTLSPTDVRYNNVDASHPNGDPTTATSVLSSKVPLTFGQAQAVRDPRQIQIGFKLFFN
jgi:hypothetical protein